jgi:DNA-binding IclR family transcriptional regulator
VSEKSNRDPVHSVRVLDRVVSILSALSDGKPRTLTELSEDIQLNSSTTHRMLAALVSHGFLQRDERSGAYRLGLACLELAKAYSDGSDLRRTAEPVLERLRDDTRETVHLALLDHYDVVYLVKVPGLHAVGIMSSRVGARAPAHCTGLGKCLLAFLPPDEVAAHFGPAGFRRFTPTTIASIEELSEQLRAIRRLGYAFDRGEHETEVRCVAAPVFDLDGHAVAAVSVAGPAHRLDPIDGNEEVIRSTCAAARTISLLLGSRIP